MGDARRSSQIMGQTDLPTASRQDFPMGNSHSLRFGEYPVAPVVPALVPAGVRDPLRDMQQVDLQENPPSGKILADLTNPTGRRSLIGDIRAVEHLRPPASDRTSEISVDLQSTRSNFSAARIPSQISD